MCWEVTWARDREGKVSPLFSWPWAEGRVWRRQTWESEGSANSLPALLSLWPVLCLPFPGCELSLSQKSDERSEMPEQ